MSGPWGVEGVPLQILSRRERVALTEAPRAYPRADRMLEVRALGWVERDARLFRADAAQRKRGTITVPNPVRAEGPTLDNGLIRLTVAPDGRCNFRIARRGRAITLAVVRATRRKGRPLHPVST